MPAALRLAALLLVAMMASMGTAHAQAPLANTAPTSDAGPDQPDEVVGSPVTLDGSGSSDMETAKDDLIYFWSQSDGPDVVLSNDRVVRPTFTPPKAGIYTFDLTVTDTGTPALGSTPTDQVIITVAAAVDADTTPPMITFDRFEHTGGVVVGTTTYLNVGDTLTAFVSSDEPLAATSLVDAALFDFDGSDRSAQDLRPVTNVANQYMATYTITAADNDAGPQFNVRGVTDTADSANTAPDFRHSLGTVTIDTVAPTITLVGGPVTVAHGGTYTETEDAGISGAGRDETPAMTTTGPDAMTVDGIVVDTTTPGAYLITYIVTDPAGNVAELTRTVTVAPAPVPNTAPTSDAGPDQPDEVVGSPVTLDGTGSSDMETAKDDLIYFWSQSDGPDVVLSNDRVVRPTFTPPKAGIYTFDLTVTDTGTPALGSTPTDQVIITVAAAVAATTPEPPVLSAGTTTHNSIALSWGAVDNAESYTLTRVVVGGADVVVAAATSELTATDTGLTPETSYKYVVTATNPAGTSADSNEVDATTLAAPVTTPEPTVTAERLPDNSIEVSWDNIPGVNFTIYAIKTGENNVIIIDLVTSPHTIATTDPLFDTANDADAIGVRGFAEGNPVGDHSAQITSDEVPDEAPAVTDTTPPTVTLGTIAEGVIDTAQDHDITFSEAVTGLAVGDFSVSSNIEASGDLVVNSVTPASGPSTTYTISITPRATAFTLTLAADSVTDTATTPNMGPAEATSVTGTATATAAPPGAPTGLTAEAGDATVTLAWTAPGATGGADITGYEYRVKAGTGEYGAWIVATTSPVTVAGLTNDTAYFFEVRAVNSGGESEASDEVTATPTATNTAPVIGTADAAVDYAENTPVATAVATYTATDAEGDTVTWTLGGTDAGDFSIDTNGALTFNTVRDFETPASDATSNTYFVTITATDNGDPNESGTLDVTVTVTNVDDEDGVVAIAITRDGTTVSGAPRVGDTLTASVTDADSGSAGVTGTTWQWQSSSAGSTTNISGATDAAYSPVAGDVGSTLQAVATYNDSTGSSKIATSAPTAPVVAPLVLTAPDDQSYTVDTAIAALELRAASGGTGTLRYTLTGPADAALPAGLSFNAGTRTLSGTPTAAATTTLTYTVTDDNGTAMADFTVTVALPRFADLNRTILPEVARAIAGHTVGAIARRVIQARADGGTDSAGSFNLGGQTTVAGVAGALASHGQAMADGTLSLKDLLGGGDFVLPLNARAAAGAPGLSSVAFWGAGDYSNLDGSGGAVDWDGDLFSAHLGADARLRDDLLVGLAVSWSRVDLDYSVPGRSGDYELDLTSFHPYVGWSALSGKLDLWATVGYGWGDLEIANEAQQASSDVEMRTVAVGGLGRLLKVGATTLRLKGDALLTEMEVEGSDEMAALTVDARRVRMILEGSRTHTLADGAQLEPSLEVGVRHDGGDGETGFGAELGGGVRYSNPVMGLTLEGRARTLVGRDSYGEWGVNGLIRLERGNGRGLSFNLSPGYGKTGSGTQRLWQQGLHDKIDGERDYGARMDLRLGYGLPAFGGRGLLTPYSEVTFGDSARNYRLGMEWELGALFELNLTGERHESSDGAADHAIMLKGEVRF